LSTVASIKSSSFTDNATNALSFVGSPLSSLDLGSAAAQGDNVFEGIPSGYAALHLAALIQVSALGNTWVPNQQGADATGNYTSLLGWLQSGKNVMQLPGSTIELF